MSKELSVTRRRLLITAIATVLGAVVGLLVFGLSPAILFGVLVGFLTGQTIHGIVYPEAAAERRPRAQAALNPGGQPGPGDGSDCDRTLQPISGPNTGLWLSLAAWGLGILVVGCVAQWGWLRGEGAGLLFMFIVLPAVALLGLMGGPTASAAARRTLKQIEAGQRPEADRGPARLALTLSRVTTVALLAFLVWLLMRANS